MTAVANGEWLHDELQTIRNRMDEQFDNVNARFDKLEERLADHRQQTEARLTALEKTASYTKGLVAIIIAAAGALAAWIKK